MPHRLQFLLKNQLIALNCFVVVLALSILTGCSSTGEGGADEDDLDYKSWSAERLYNEAKRELKAGDYQLAIEYYETIESRYPFGKLAEFSQLEAAYAYYKFEEYDNAIAAADRFIKLHPSHANVDYAYYLRGLAAFHKKDTPMDSLFPQDPSERDPGSTRESFTYFAELVRKFPKSKYSPDAIQRMRFQRNTLARHELKVAEFYMRKQAYVAAANRAKYVVENYSKTPAVLDALKLLSEAYAKLEMHDLARDTKKVLELNLAKQAKSTASETGDKVPVQN